MEGHHCPQWLAATRSLGLFCFYLFLSCQFCELEVWIWMRCLWTAVSWLQLVFVIECNLVRDCEFVFNQEVGYRLSRPFYY